MDDIPVEVIGNILSGLGDARDIVNASATCSKWREAYHKHLHTLSFDSVGWPSYKSTATSPSTLETFITQTIFQTSGLQRISIKVGSCYSFSAASVLAWLLHARETLLELRYNVPTNPRVNILEICGRNKLEVIELAHNSIWAVEPKFQRFPCLKSLSLRYVIVSASHLNLLLSGCPKIESLELINPRFIMFDVPKMVELSSPTLKRIFVEAVRVDKLTVEADCLEILHLKGCALEDFELIGKGSLKQIKLDDASITHLYISENIESLEVVDICNFSIFRPIFSEMISKSSSLMKLRLWNSKVTLENENEDEVDDMDEVEDMDEDEDDDEFEAEDANEDLETNHISTHQLNHYSVDLETIAVSFPKLSHLCLNYNLRDGSLNHNIQGSSYLTNVTVLELGWTVLTDVFLEWVESLLKRCPNLKRLVIHGVISDAKSQDKCHTLTDFISSMFRLMRNYMHVEVQFEFT
ncbi:unnamed protein product [Rhodiola kirilowii]